MSAPAGLSLLSGQDHEGRTGMEFLGADTEALRGQARVTRQCGRTLLERSSALSSTVGSVQWHGPDAEELRQRWSAVERQLRDAAETLGERARELAEHADEQDRASSGDDGRSVWDRLGLPELPSMPTLVKDVAGPVSDLLGVARQLAGGVVPSLPGGGNSLLAGLNLGGRGLGGRGLSDLSALSAALGDPSILDLVGGPKHTGPPATRYSGEYDNPEDEFDATPGEGTTSVTAKVESDRASVEYTEDSDGNKSGKVEISAPLADVDGKAGRSDVSYDLTVKSTGEYTENGDGTITYKVSSELSDEAKAELDAKIGKLPAGGSLSSGSSQSTEYEVTVPEGTSLAEALAINPFDPSSIPPGATVTFENSTTRTGGAEVHGGPLGSDVLSVGATESNGEGTSTSIGRDAEGDLSVTNGPTSAMNSTFTTRLGTEDLNVHLSQSDDRGESTFQTATFEDNAAGRRAYQEALSAGQFPADAGNGVVTSYTEHQSTRIVDVTGGVTTGPLTVDKTDNMFTHQSITRTYPDGHQESAEQYVPHGDRNATSVVRSESTDRAPSYVVTLDTPEGSDAFEKAYGVSPSGDRASVVLSESEARTIADHARGLRMVPDDASDAEAISSVLRRASDADAAVFDLESHNATVDETGRSEPIGGDYTAPGRGFDPERQTVRDGKVVDTP